MPSPTESTVPVSATSTLRENSRICLRMISEISSARICMSSCPSGIRSGAAGAFSQGLELGAEAAVVDDAVDFRDQPGEELRVDLRLELDFSSSRHARELVGQGAFDLFRQRRGGG